MCEQLIQVSYTEIPQQAGIFNRWIRDEALPNVVTAKYRDNVTRSNMAT